MEILYIQIGGIALLIGIFLYMALKPRYCPKCNTKLPIWRKPKNKRQALWGGDTCPNCGCEVDRKGKEVTNS